MTERATSPAGHARSPDPQGAQHRRAARPRGLEPHRAADRWHVRAAAWLAVSRAPPSRGGRLAHVVVAALREQPAREVLHAHQGGRKAAGRREGPLEPDRARHGARARRLTEVDVSFYPRLAALWRNLTQRARVERDLDDELRAALDLLVAEKIRRGMPPEDARRAAALELGGLDLVKEQVRDARAGAGLESLFQDLRYAARTVRRAPIVALTGVLSLGIGIAGNAVVFSLADAYLFRDQPGIANPDRLAEVGRTDSGGGAVPVEDGGFDTFSYPELSRLPRAADGVRWTGRLPRRRAGAVRARHGRRSRAGAWRVRLGQLLRRAGRADGPWTRLRAGRRATRESQRRRRDQPSALADAVRRSAGHRRPHGAAERAPVHDRGRRERGLHRLQPRGSAPVGPDHRLPGRRRPPAGRAARAAVVDGHRAPEAGGEPRAGRRRPRAHRPRPGARVPRRQPSPWRRRREQPARCRWTADRS